MMAPNSFTLSESAVINVAGGFPIYWLQDSAGANSLTGILTVENCVFDLLSDPCIMMFDPTDTTITLKEITFARSNGGQDLIRVVQKGTGVNLVLSDIIGLNEDRILREDSGAAAVDYASLDFSNLAPAGSTNATDSTNQAVIDAMAALYGGSGPLEDDPLYASGDGSGYDVLDGVVGWDSETNTLFDVTSGSYAWKGTGGLHPHNALAGGAEPTEAVPVELSEFMAD